MGPIRADSDGYATFQHVPADAGYRVVAVAWRAAGGQSVSWMDLPRVDPGQRLEETVILDLKGLVP